MNKISTLSKIPVTKSSTLSNSSSTFVAPASINNCIAILQSCAIRKNLTIGQQLHGHMVTSGYLSSSPLSATSLISMYSKCNQMTAALLVFNNATHHHNVFVYNAIISGFISNGLAEEGLELYREMRRTGFVPDKFTFPCLIKGCRDAMDGLEVKKIHGLVFKFGLELDVFVGSALVNAYLKFQFMDDANDLFEELPQRDVVLWNSMVNGYAQIGRFNEALDVFRRMAADGVLPSRITITGLLSVFSVMGDFGNGRVVHGFVIKMGHDSGINVCNALIDMYGKCNYVGDALEIFKTMDEKDIFSWNSILSAHERCEDDDGTLRLFDRMMAKGVRPDLITVTTVLPACSNLAALMHGKQIHCFMIINGLAKGGYCDDFNDVQMNNAIMDMYAKCGSTREAQLVFSMMSYKDVASWNIMVLGYGMHGYGNEALEMFSVMCESGLKPDEVSFVGVLSACSHSGFVREGHNFLKQMEMKYDVVPTIEHYACVIDMLGRAGQLEEAYALAMTMPIEANPVVWRALLAACRLHGNTDLAEVVSQRVLELEPEHCGNYILMSNVYVAAGRYEQVLDVRHTMRQQRVQKIPGCSWIELKNGVHVFTTSDGIHPEAKLIYAALQSLTEHGYVLDT